MSDKPQTAFTGPGHLSSAWCRFWWVRAHPTTLHPSGIGLSLGSLLHRRSSSTHTTGTESL